jgi:NitT/TauT family transport system substrate-binding protein
MAKTLARPLRGLAVAACAVLAVAAAPRPAFADDTLNVIGASSTSGFFEVLDHVADRAGFFKAEHLIVHKEYINGAAPTAQLAASGKADIASCAIEPLIFGYAKGLRLQFFFGEDPQYVFGLGVLDDSPIRTLADFKGKTIGEATLGSGGEVGTISMLEGAGLSRSDFSFVAIGFGATALAAVRQGQVAGSAEPTAELSLEAAAGGVKWRIFRHPVLKDIGTYGFSATPATIAAKGDQLKRFSRAIAKAALLTRVNPQLAARYFLEGAGQKVTDDALKAEVQTLELSQGDLAGADPANPRLGYMSLTGIGVYTKFFTDNGLTAQTVPASAIVTNQFIAAANDFDHKAFIAQARAMR